MNRFSKLLLGRMIPLILALAIALLFGGICISLSGGSPLAAYLQLIRGATGVDVNWTFAQPIVELIPQPGRIGNSLTEATPLLLAGLAIGLPLAGGFFNLGAEGQILMGGLGATLAGLNCAHWSGPAPGLIALFNGALFGALWALIPAWLRVYRQMNEIITAIMLNFIAFWIVSYLVHGPLKESGGFGYPWSPELPVSVRLPRWPDLRVNLGFPLAIGAVGIVAILLQFTTFGYALRAIGSNREAARFAGIRVERTLLSSMAIAGALAGLAGAVVILGVQLRLTDSFSPGYGFDAIAVAFVGQNTPIGILLVGILFGAFRTGAEAMELSAGIPRSLAMVIQAVALLFAVGYQSRWLTNWRARVGSRRLAP